MLDIPSISAIVAAVGVLIGVALTVLELRNITRTRQMDLIIRIRSMWLDKVCQSWLTIRKIEFKSYDDYEEKCLLEAHDVAVFFDSLGLLSHKGLVDIGLISQLFIVGRVWKKMQLFVEGARKTANEPRTYRHFEYLYNEWKKEEQKGVKSG